MIERVHKKKRFIEEFANDYKVRCKCGSTRMFTEGKFTKDRLICTNCGYWVYKDKETEKRYKFKEIMKGKL